MPLQKSFSEQNDSRPRQRWHKFNSHSAASRSSTTVKVNTKLLEPVSEVTKNKLNAFNFRPTTDRPEDKVSNPEANDENDARAHTGPKPSIELGTEVTSPLPASKYSTSTPVSRLAWQDLIGVSEVKEEEEDTSPNERIGWDTRKQPMYTLSPMMPRKRGKKRARSSSPISSPATHPKPNTPAVNVKKLSRALKSPHADPAIELWDRFSLSGSTSVTPLGAQNPALAQIMVPSSPQPSRVLGAVPAESGLRRAISCGAHWPKRRRVERAETAPSLEVMVEESPSGHSKSSMVNALLKSVTGEINRSSAVQVHDDALRSPSPRKRRQKPAVELTGSPNRRQTPTKSSPPLSTEAVTDTILRPAPAIENYCSSDYGDDDFDDDTLMELDATVDPVQRPDENPILPPQPKLDTGQAAHQPPMNQELDSYDDEFADLDDDIFAAAEVFVSQVDSTHASRQRSDILPVTTVGDSVQGVISEDTAEDLYGDDFGGDFDFEAAEMAATQFAKQTDASLPLPAQPAHKPKAIQRYLVTKVLESQYTDPRGRESPEKILFVEVDRSKVMKTVHLRGDWVDTPASPKAYIHILGAFEPSGQCVIDNSQNIIVLHPDQLISATVIADSFTCMRRAVLQDRVKATSDKTPPLVYGTLLHEIFQEALMSNQWSLEFLDGIICRITEKHVEDLYTIKVSINGAREHLRSKMPELKCWAAAFVSPFPRPDAVVQSMNGRNGQNANMCVTKLLDVEEHVWSPLYGMKGNIDATVQVTMKDGKQRRTLTVPFEVKTGKNETTNHHAQTSLYNLLLSDRYDVEIAYGILYYMETSKTVRIPTVRNELRHMIMQRNQLACYVRDRSVQLPPMKRSTNTCGNCYAKVSCFIYHKLADNGDQETSGVKGKFDEVVQHLTPTHQEFFLKWEDLLTKEERESQKMRRELWTMVSTEREKVGRCFANVITEEGSAFEDSETPKINRYSYNFIKENPGSSFSFLDSQLVVGEPIVISDEKGHFALALGYVTSVRKQRIGVAVDRRLHNARIRRPGFDEIDNQVFASIMEVVPEGATPAQSQGKIKEAPVRYRLDKDEFSNGMATVRNNLVQVMADGVFGSREIRRLVVDLAPPRFKATTTQYSVADQASLNVDQKRAIAKVMSANDYALVLGMPGTGKTTTIAHIIRALVGQGKSVLLTSYTHSAVDNILLKLKNEKYPILRLGAPAKVHPVVQDFAILGGQPMNTFEEIRSAWHDTPVVATTCLGVNHPVFSERTFDYCIVDEASQITLPICIGPIRMAHTFVLVGDHNQLPPLVQNEPARAGGLDISLFKLLSDTHPDSVVNLEHQYRMCEDVMTLSNTLIYEGRLKCGTEALRHQKLEIPHMDHLRQRHYDANTIMRPDTPRSFCTSWSNAGCWLRNLLDPEARVRFVNTDNLPSPREEAKGNRTVNPTESRIVVQLVDALLTAGVAASDIGVMTHYRSQLSLLKHGLRGYGSSIELHTADRFQGRDKEVVILSLVRSNEACSIGDLLKDWRRINVAFTRAKTKLLVVGSRDTLKGSGEQEMLSRFVRLMEERDWVYDLPSDALESHFFEDGATQITATGAPGSQPSPTKRSPKKICKGSAARSSQVLGGKENQRPGPKRGNITGKALLRKNPISRDILNELTGGIY
ncbi:Uu.00g121800.m01.CDS01 [Anthostomella pinea]|uniref:DNA replication ATP-dependent helicase/nuclease n=1 Tax=Anthostomella pinea TaxID=933095 RepID=A0AAI8YHD1_9PEZI|nr:Uu.00g121800.m01.CDS01 [Anthostomella pinea]